MKKKTYIHNCYCIGQAKSITIPKEKQFVLVLVICGCVDIGNGGSGRLTNNNDITWCSDAVVEKC